MHLKTIKLKQMSKIAAKSAGNLTCANPILVSWLPVVHWTSPMCLQGSGQLLRKRWLISFWTLSVSSALTRSRRFSILFASRSSSRTWSTTSHKLSPRRSKTEIHEEFSAEWKVQLLFVLQLYDQEIPLVESSTNIVLEGREGRAAEVRLRIRYLTWGTCGHPRWWHPRETTTDYVYMFTNRSKSD